MMDIAKDFIAESRSFLSSDYLPKIESCLEGLSDEDVWWRANEESNSIGNLLLHLEGSTRAWIVNVTGGSNSPRDRQQEFDERERIPRAELMARLKQTLVEADEVLARLDGATLLERRQTPWKEVTLLLAVYHAVEHFSMHTGQIIMLAKMRSGAVKLSD
ncbi:MAG: DinB family protein [bacterium]